ncbi:uncharacterized protein B0T15DRAFT_489231 [Chaetomium strumarium]|uniref:Uncharacterized protein n=1 Tax=Chaetomium strumarium TaxID=1170767 RepID=A0AAJ0H2C3_9PEZI|nr:hypothetical protein B0T15DRAFT_489231 [Chaetomium strumarium]
MATNSSRGNDIAAEDGPPKQNTPSTPHVSAELKSDIRQRTEGGGGGVAASGGSAGLHATGQDAGSVAPGAHVETVDEVIGGGGGGEEGGASREGKKKAG